MKTAAKLDLCKLHKSEYVTPKTPVLIRTRPARYLVIDGQGAPGGELFGECIGALYGMAFTIKMTRKFAGKQDYTLGRLEGIWFFDRNACELPPDQWKWKLLIRTPDFVTQRDLKQAATTLEKRGKGKGVEKVRLETIREGDCVQMLHVGPYDQECKTFSRMVQFAEARGLEIAGPHHEIYLSDPRRVPPERLKTILRQPVRKAKRS